MRNIDESISTKVTDTAKSVLGDDFKFRENQLEVITKIVTNCLEGEHSSHIVQAPTGSGKSIILMLSAIVLSVYYAKTSYLLCSDLSLWKQYEDFVTSHDSLSSIVGMLKGTHSYICSKNDKSVDKGVCKLASISWKDLCDHDACASHGFGCAQSCKYIADKKKAMSSDVTIMTYQMYFKTVSNPKALSWPSRDVVFCDECHNLPSLLQQAYCPRLKDTDISKMLLIFDYALSYQEDMFGTEETNEIVGLCKKSWSSRTQLETELKNAFDDLFSVNLNASKNIVATVRSYYDVVDELRPISSRMLKLISSKTKDKKNSLSAVEYEVYEACNWLTSTLDMLLDYINLFGPSEDDSKYAAVTTSESTVQMFSSKSGKMVNKREHIIELQYAKEDKLCKKFLMNEEGPSNIVLTSATIGDMESFASNLGLDNPELDDMPSTFNFSNSPIYVLSRWKMSQKYKDENLPKVQNATYELCERYKDKKGIIQTWTYDIAKKIYDEAPYEIKSKMLLYNDSKEKRDLIEFHKNVSQPTILVGPTLNEGIDLPGDGCRFILMLKMPYPYLGSTLVAKKKEIYEGWYSSETLRTIIQSLGRGIRYDGDWCHTYILDGSFSYFFYQMREFFPIEMQKRFKFFK